MTDSLFCPNCGMLKENCVCGKYKNSNKHNNSLDDFSNKKHNNIVDDIIPDVYSIKNHKLDNNRINDLKKQYPNIDDDIIENFPFPSPRTGQLDIIQNIEEAISKGYKYIVLEAGTGTGKSAVATTLANIYGSAYILTMTKQLQHQYAKEFGFPIVKGRSNFSCLMGGSEATCDMGVCKTTVNSKKFFCPFSITKVPKLTSTIAFEDSFGNDIYYNSDNHCNYWEQKANAINSPITLMNYDYAILELNYVKHFGTRSLLILDEAHNIENKLMNSLELTLSNQRLEKDIKRRISKETLKDGSVEDWILELESLYESYQDVDLKDLPMNKVDRIRRTISRIKLLRDHLEHEPKNWVIDANEYSVSFKPLRVNKYAKDNLLKYGDICIFMSATILSHKMFSKWLGLDPNEVYYIKVDSPFPPEKRPIILDLAGKMSKNRIKKTAPKTIPIVNKILRRHSDEKGLIHSHSYKCSRFITQNIPNARLISHTPANRQRVLDYFEKDSDPLVLVSPSMSEGVDLPYDKCRFQIIYKVPFPYLGDKQINLRQKRDKRWYAYKTVMTIMQAYGRGMRAEDDYCTTYILDKDILMLFKSPLYRSLIPDFFKEAIVENDYIKFN
ncbi:ATP-dependent helicase [Methanobrevibacter sp. 87.7]|uniref:helicase C-terminal domain-containing protein n=1 Tax=Methanobrevibacter sp. 87.7 TaxID=387957 RepID=UPI000B5044B3|nr:ATP-dependent DNA helicase [Methanobrevibacter sp. 87.7]OWT33262.1 ATP-dependent helicase [Methanobrevibacter sp. 87.7]